MFNEIICKQICCSSLINAKFIDFEGNLLKLIDPEFLEIENIKSLKRIQFIGVDNVRRFYQIDKLQSVEKIFKL